MFWKSNQMPLRDMNSIKSIKSNVEYNTLKTELSNYNKAWKIIRLKRWTYTTSDIIRDSWWSFNYFVSNKIYQPSYVSTTSALDYYNILSESTFWVSAISNKKTLIIKNKLSNFSYKSIKSELFIWFKLIKIWKYDIFLATKAKAIFDYFWYKKNMFKYFNFEELESFRLNLDLINKKDILEFGKYAKVSKSKKMSQLYSLLQKYVARRN